MFEVALEKLFTWEDAELIFRVLTAVVLGGIVGFERGESKNQQGLKPIYL